MPVKYKSWDVFVQGKVKWFRSTRPDIQFPPPRWSHVMYPNTESLEKIRELQSQGLKNVIKKDEDGYYVSFSRKTEMIRSGKTMGMLPPEVFDKDGVTPMKDVNVGNGSDVTTKLRAYEHGTPSGGKSVAVRWESSKIDNLVPFEGKRDFLEYEAKAAEGLKEQPAQW